MANDATVPARLRNAAAIHGTGDEAMNTATMVKEHTQRESKSWVTFGPAALYKLSEPYTYDSARPPCEFMFVSTSAPCGEWETYAFPADETGDCLSWAELPGSMKGEWTHADVLREMGYEFDATRTSRAAGEGSNGQ